MVQGGIVSCPVQPVGLGELCGGVYDRFTSAPDLMAVAVVEKGKPIGLLKRLDFLTRLADKYGRPLYEAKPVTSLMDTNPVMVEETESLDTLNAMLLADSGNALQHGFIVLENGFYKGIGTASTILQNNMARTEERMIELEYAQREADSANKAKTQFLANMSHELRTPLNAIIGFSEFLLTEAERGREVGNFEGYISDIRSSGKHLLGVINSILDMSKIEAGAFELSEDYVYTDELADQVIRMMEGMAWTKKITLQTVGFSNDSELYVDVQVLKQALINLLSNAIKFSPEGADVNLISRQHPNGEFEICVCDNGPGLGEEALQKVLEPFVQAEAEHNRRFEGSGLGLPLVKAFIEAHGGRFELESTQGKGTNAKVFLPANRHKNGVTLQFAM